MIDWGRLAFVTELHQEVSALGSKASRKSRRLPHTARGMKSSRSLNVSEAECRVDAGGSCRRKKCLIGVETSLARRKLSWNRAIVGVVDGGLAENRRRLSKLFTVNELLVPGDFRGRSWGRGELNGWSRFGRRVQNRPSEPDRPSCLISIPGWLRSRSTADGGWNQSAWKSEVQKTPAASSESAIRVVRGGVS